MRQIGKFKPNAEQEVKMNARLMLLFLLLMSFLAACSSGSSTTSSGTATGMALPAQVSAVTATNAN
jgi:hypothetical protein